MRLWCGGWIEAENQIMVKPCQCCTPVKVVLRCKSSLHELLNVSCMSAQNYCHQQVFLSQEHLIIS